MTYSKSFDVRVNHEPWINQTLSIYFTQITVDRGVRSVALAEPCVFRTLTEPEMCQHLQPSIQLPLEAGQQLMDELWRAGLRPTEGTGSAGSLAATEKHLNDMRRLAFAKIINEKP